MKRSIEGKLKDLCEAHSQLQQAIGKSRTGGASKVLMEMWQEQLTTLETTIIATLKEGFGEKRLGKQGDQNPHLKEG